MQGDRHMKRALKPTEGAPLHAWDQSGPGRGWEGPSRGPRNGRRRALKEMKSMLVVVCEQRLHTFHPSNFQRPRAGLTEEWTPGVWAPAVEVYRVWRDCPLVPSLLDVHVLIYDTSISILTWTNQGAQNLKSRLFWLEILILVAVGWRMQSETQHMIFTPNVCC